ncbi:hypothetical protein ACFOLC_11915 [Lysobacter cavernae]|uniref:Uncharacterized protein n=1 Tax=Lysobacter cavernae TaxID=1685901 RepID=A0ABV7RQD9_9GAMM
MPAAIHPFFVLALAVASPSLTAQAVRSEETLIDSGDAAHLFAYTPKPGMRAQFDAGYRAHLRWHRDRQDPLPWFGWDIVDGDRAGLFVDGSFGTSFAAFEQRIDPVGDQADAARNVTAYAEPAFRASYRLRRELSTALPLEHWRPSEIVQVFHYTLRPGTQPCFEQAVRAARTVLLGEATAPAHSWYEKRDGGIAPEYMLMIAHYGQAGYDHRSRSLETLLERSGNAAALADLTASATTVKTETWSYRADLSLIPGR